MIEYLENLRDSLNQIIGKYNNPTIWLARDLNLPNIDWLRRKSLHIGMITLENLTLLLVACNFCKVETSGWAEAMA